MGINEKLMEATKQFGYPKELLELLQGVREDLKKSKHTKAKQYVKEADNLVQLVIGLHKNPDLTKSQLLKAILNLANKIKNDNIEG